MKNDEPGVEQSGKTGDQTKPKSGSGSEECALENHWTDFEANANGDLKPLHTALRPDDIIESLLRTHGDRIGRVGSNVFVELAGNIISPDGAEELFGLLHQMSRHARWRRHGTDRYGCCFFSVPGLQALLRCTVREYAAASTAPLFPVRPEVYVSWSPPAGYQPDGSYLEQYMGRFRFATEADAALGEALVLTPAWGGPPSQRPCFAITPPLDMCLGAPQGDDNKLERGIQDIGKSTFARKTGSIYGGNAGLTIPRSRGGDSIARQLAAPVNVGRRIGLFDNVIGMIASPRLADLITAECFEGRASYGKQERRQNLMTFVVTSNELSMTRDLASRTVNLQMGLPNRDDRWLLDTNAFIQEHRDHILADIIHKLEHGERYEITATRTRFPTWDDSILALFPAVNQLLALIHERQQFANAETTELKLFLQRLKGQFPSSHDDLRMDVMATVFKHAVGRDIGAALLGRVLRNHLVRGELVGLRPRSRRNGTPWVWKPDELGDEYLGFSD